MAKIIVFPRPHREFQYYMDRCSCCKEVLNERDIQLEITDPVKQTVGYLCSHCTSDSKKRLLTKKGYYHHEFIGGI